MKNLKFIFTVLCCALMAINFAFAQGQGQGQGQGLLNDTGCENGNGFTTGQGHLKGKSAVECDDCEDCCTQNLIDRAHKLALNDPLNEKIDVRIVGEIVTYNSPEKGTVDVIAVTKGQRKCDVVFAIGWEGNPCDGFKMAVEDTYIKCPIIIVLPPK